MKANYKQCNKKLLFAFSIYQRVMNSLLNYARHISITEMTFAKRMISSSVYQ